VISAAKRISLLQQLGNYMLSDDAGWQDAKRRALLANSWFTAENIQLAVENIVTAFLPKEKLEQWLAQYSLPANAKTVGITMAGNIPLVGFHDFLCGFVSGHNLKLKLSSKDEVLLRHIIQQLAEWEPAIAGEVVVADLLKQCDAYIATGSNNSARYFEQYFGKYPHIIRRNRTSVAVLDGSETPAQLEALNADIFTYFGLGCRNVTQVCVPERYDLHHKYNNNYDYHLALYLLNRVPYMTNDVLLMVENALPFSAVSVLHYRYYNDKAALTEELTGSKDIQCIVGKGFMPFGSTQQPGLSDYADGVDVMAFLCSL
jgi:hypothetical protein